MVTQTPPESAQSHQLVRDKLWKVLASSLAGTTIEWYEFFIYGTAAALVFNKLFFPDFSDLAGTMLALSTFAIAFVARPVGGVIFGHFGDRIGRKPMLVVTLSMMGGATFAIGLLPTHASIGALAPVLLVLLRLIQGLSLGGEYSGAVLMSVEHAPPHRRGLAGGIINSGAAWGSILASVVYLPVAALPDAAFQAWGWRIPFLASIILVGIGMFIRLRLHESPDFQLVRREGAVRKLPITDVLTRHPQLVVLMAVAYLSAGVTFYTGAVFSLAYGQEQLGLERSTLISLVLATSILTVIVLPLFGWLGDRVDRRKIFMVGAAGMGVAPFVWFPMFNTQIYALMLAGSLLMFLPYCANYGAMATFFAHVFPAEVRFTGMSLGYTIGTVAGSATAPLVATYLLDRTGGWIAIAGYMAVVAVLSLMAAWLMSEHKPESAKASVAVAD
jgi:MFS family permease